ncbi:IclR family transcriptional regulator C-terminal domain-containing protein [Prescottella defluvii]|nr:IclR family transcriptional regulator C-terminal domain-containing protein [Prescottella defluvii]
MGDRPERRRPTPRHRPPSAPGPVRPHPRDGPLRGAPRHRGDLRRSHLRQPTRPPTRACRQPPTATSDRGREVLLAYQDPWFRESYLANSLERHSRFTITEPARLARELDTIREQGYAKTQEEMALGSCSVAIPVRAPNDEVVAAIGVVLPSNRSTDMTRYLPPLRGTGARLEKVFKALPQPVEQAIRSFWLG